MAYFGDQLHVSVLNTVVHHLDVVSGTLITNPVAAGLTITLGRHALEDILDKGPGLLVTAGHQAGAVTGTFFTARDAGAYEPDALLGQVLGSAVGVRVVRVSAINNDVTLFDEGEQALNEVVDRLAGHDQQHDTTGLLQLRAEFLHRVGSHDRLSCSNNQHASPPPPIPSPSLQLWHGRPTLGLVGKESIDLLDCAVESHDGESMVSHVHDEVLAHHSQADEAEVSTARQSQVSQPPSNEYVYTKRAQTYTAWSAMVKRLSNWCQFVRL